MKILITGCNTLRKPIVESLKHNRDGRDVYIVGINSNEWNILREGVDRYYISPRIDAFCYVDWLIKLCKYERINIIIPLLNAEVEVASDYKARLEKEGIKVSVASKETLAIVNRKIALYNHYPEYMPRQTVCRNKDDLKQFMGTLEEGALICCKTDGLSGGRGFYVVGDEYKAQQITQAQLENLIETSQEEIIVQEYIEGTDYNTVVLADQGKLVGVCGFSGGNFELGAYSYGEMLKVPEAYAITERIVRETGLDGNACFDFILKPNGTPILLECNPRVSAGLPFPCAAGADFIYQRCKMLLGEEYATDYNIDYNLKMALLRNYIFYKSVCGE